MNLDRKYLALVGLAVGTASAALGIGGGTIAIPLLVMLFGYGIKKAIGTSLALMVPTVAVAVAFRYLVRSEDIVLSVAVMIALGAIIGAMYGAKVAHRLSSWLLAKLFGFVILFVGLNLAGVIPIPSVLVSNSSIEYPLLIIVGLVAGFASALFGIGGATITIPVMNLFFGLSIHQATATSLAIILPTSIVGALSHNKFKHVDSNALKYMILPAFLGAILGTFIAYSVSGETLGIVVGIYFVICSLQFILQKRGEQDRQETRSNKKPGMKKKSSQNKKSGVKKK